MRAQETMAPRLHGADRAMPTLDTLARGQPARIVQVATRSAEHDAQVALRLMELGFLPGASVRVVARGWGGQPLAVRIGQATFALRRSEAALIQVAA